MTAAMPAMADRPRGLAHYIMGATLEFQDDIPGALSEYEKAAQNDPFLYPALMRAGVLSIQLGRTSAAVRAFANAVKLDPDDPQAHYLLALAYASGKDLGRAAQEYEIVLQKASADDPQSQELRLTLAQFYTAWGKQEKAVAQYERLLQAKPEHTEALLNVGSWYLYHGRRNEGRAMLERCIAADPVQPDCLNALGYSYAEDNVDLDKAARLIERALAVEPQNAAYLDSLGWVHFRQGRFFEALEELNKAVAFDRDPEILGHIGDVYDKMGRFDQALEAWEEALKLDGAMIDVRSKIKAARRSQKKK